MTVLRLLDSKSAQTDACGTCVYVHRATKWWPSKGLQGLLLLSTTPAAKDLLHESQLLRVASPALTPSAAGLCVGSLQDCTPQLPRLIRTRFFCCAVQALTSGRVHGCGCIPAALLHTRLWIQQCTAIYDAKGATEARAASDKEQRRRGCCYCSWPSPLAHLSGLYQTSVFGMVRHTGIAL